MNAWFRVQLLSTAPIGKRKGQGMVEYGLIIALIAVVVIAVLILTGGRAASLFTGVGSSV